VKWLAAAACACSAAPAPVPLAGQAAHTTQGYCVERELPCEHGDQIVNGKRVKVLAATDCVGPRHVECWLPAHVDHGLAHDVVGLGGGRYRFMRGTELVLSRELVTVDHGHETVVRGGAPRTYGPFGPYGLTAESADGRVEVIPGYASNNMTTVIQFDAGDTVAIRQVGNFTTPFPIELEGPHAQRPATFASARGDRFGACARDPNGRNTWLETGRSVELPLGSCLAADVRLAHLLVSPGRGELVDVDLGTGARIALSGMWAAFAGDGWVVIDEDRRVRYVGPDRIAQDVATVPFYPDVIVVAPDARSAVVLHEPTAGEPARAFLVSLPSGPGSELPIPPDTVAITLVP